MISVRNVHIKLKFAIRIFMLYLKFLNHISAKKFFYLNIQEFCACHIV